MVYRANTLLITCIANIVRLGGAPYRRPNPYGIGIRFDIRGPGICLRLASLSHYVRAQIPLGRAPLESQRGADCEGKKREWVRESESRSGGLACLGLNK